MGFMGFLRGLFFKNKKLSVLGSAAMALAIGIQGLFDKEKKEVEKEIVKQELVVKETKKYMAEGREAPEGIDNEGFEKEKEKLKKLNLELKRMNNEEEQVKVIIKALEAEPLYERGHNNSIYNLRVETEKAKKELAIVEGLQKLDDDDYDLLRNYVMSVSGEEFPTEILKHFSGTVNLKEIIKYIDDNESLISDNVFNEEFHRSIRLDNIKTTKRFLKNSKKEKARLEGYFKVNETLVKLLKSKGSQRRLRSYTDKMNKLNDDLAEYLLELDKYIDSLQRMSDFCNK